MTLSEELSWRGFVNQTTLTDIKLLDSHKFTFYWGVDPSADSMTVGHLAMAMMVKHFIAHGQRAVLLVGGATGMIGDPDGKAEERKLLSLAEIKANKTAIAEQYKRLFKGLEFRLVDNYDWFKDMKYLDFLRDVGKHVPMRQMLGREFVQTRLAEAGSGISYAEFSYVLIQAYDFLYMHQTLGVDMQVCGSDQWGNSVAGVDLIRRVTGNETHVWSGPLIINPQTGVKFGKTEAGAVWLDPNKTSPTNFYQFWVNSDDAAVEHYLKIYTELTEDEISKLMQAHRLDPAKRLAQFRLADEVCTLVHGSTAMQIAKTITNFLRDPYSVAHATNQELKYLRSEIAHTKTKLGDSIVKLLVDTGLAASNTAAKQLLSGGSVYINSKRVDADSLQPDDLVNGRAIIRRGKSLKDSALIEVS